MEMDNLSPSPLSASAVPFVPSTVAPYESTEATEEVKIVVDEADEAADEWIEVKRPVRKPKVNQPSQPQVFGTGPTKLLNQSGQLPPSSSRVDVATESIRAGRKVLILMRGAPGSGKSTLAKKLLSLRPDGVIFTTDDYFVQVNLLGEEIYTFDPTVLELAHKWNFQRAAHAIENGVTPVIIDNTNTQVWEMTRYVLSAVQNLYEVHFIEPETEWKFKPGVLARKNSHGVLQEHLERMVERYEHGITLLHFLPFIQNFYDQLGIQSSEIIINQKPSSVTSVETDISLGSSVLVLEPTANDFDCPISLKTSSSEFSWEDVDSKPDCDLSSPEATQISLPSDLSPVESDRVIKTRRSLSETAIPSISESADLNPLLTAESLVVISKSPVAGRKERRKVVSGGFFSAAVDKTAGSWKLPEFATVKKAEQLDVVSDLELNNNHIGRRVTVCGSCQTDDFHWNWEDFSTIQSPLPADLIPTEKLCQTEVSIPLKMADDESSVSMVNGSASLNELYSCFSEVPTGQIDELVVQSNGDMNWVMNVLLDKSVEPLVPSAGPTNSGMESGDNGMSEMLDAPPPLVQKLILSETMDMGMERSHPTKSSLDSEASTVSTTLQFEMGTEMASDLQGMFGKIFDIPTEMLSPEHLKVDLPADLAAQLYGFWRKTIERQAATARRRIPEMAADEKIARMLQQEENDKAGVLVPLGAKSSKPQSLREVMAEEMAQQKAQKEWNRSNKVATQKKMKGSGGGNVADDNSQFSLATKLNLKKLSEMFPSIERSLLLEMFRAHGYKLDATVDSLVENNFFFAGVPVPKNAAAEGISCESDRSGLANPDSTSSLKGYDDLRADAVKYHQLRVEAFEKAKAAYRKGMSDVAFYYAQEGHMYQRKLREANEAAAEQILKERRAAHPNGDTLDLHGLHVPEALKALSEFLQQQVGRLSSGGSVTVVTGSGRNSRSGQPKLKPSVMSYLKSTRRYRMEEINQGAIAVFSLDIK